MIYLTFCRSTAYFCAAGIAVRRLPCSDSGFVGQMRMNLMVLSQSILPQSNYCNTSITFWGEILHCIKVCLYCKNSDLGV